MLYSKSSAHSLNLPLLAVLIFIIGFSWVALLTQGLPIGDPDDWDHVLAAADRPWNKLFISLAAPVSTSSQWTGQIDRFNEVYHRRVGLTTVLKTIYTFAGTHSWPFYLFSKALFFALSLTLLSYVLFLLTHSRFFSFGGVIFYLFVPAHYPHLLWITDPITMVHCLLLLQTVLFIRLFRRMEHPDENRWKLILDFIALFLLGWITIRTKEPGIIFPLAAGTTLVLNLKNHLKHTKGFILLLSIFALHLFLIIPFGASSEASRHPLSFDPQTILRMLLRNYGCGYQDEIRCAFFSLHYVWPVSIAGTIGFFLLWALLFSGAFTLINRLYKKIGGETDPIAPLTRTLLFVWLGGDILLMGFFQPDPRYFSGTMIPITLLGTDLLARTYAQLSLKWKPILSGTLMLALLWTSSCNIRSILWLRLQIGQRVNRYFTIASSIFKDQFPSKSSDPMALARYYAAQYVPKGQSSPRIADVIFYAASSYGAWQKVSGEPILISEYEHFAKKGAVYYITKNSNPFPYEPKITLLTTVAGINSSSFLEIFLYRIKNHPPESFYIYKWRGE